MKHLMNGTVVTLGWLLVLTMVMPAQSGMGGQRPMGPSGGAAESSSGGPMGMMGPQMMPGMGEGARQGMPEGMARLRPGQLVRMLKGELGLSDEQVKQLTPIFSQTVKTRIKQRADLRIAEMELGELLEAEPVDLGRVESQLKSIEGLRTTLRLTLIKAHEQAKGILTPEQRQKLEQWHDRHAGMMGVEMMRMMEMMGEGGPGGMGMMSPQMRQQMMRGMMGGQPAGTAGEHHPEGR